MATEAVTNLTKDEIANYAPDVLAGRHVGGLPGADQRQREAVQARPRQRARRRS
ncbi:MAG: hypothetical protein M0C28_16550 [Candidatus Moduliflexus flocculans]|nr:hypothetical protein [Candidatus Moduliflexus flocculans]